MIRRVFSLVADDYAWLVAQAKKKGVSTSTLVRFLIARARKESVVPSKRETRP